MTEQGKRPAEPAPLSIAATERETGLPKETLRVWERRYGFPAPGRDVNGQRIYPWPQVERLRRLGRLVAAGHRPGRLVGLSSDELSALDAPAAPSAPAFGPGPGALPLDECLATLRGGGSDALRQWLLQAFGRLGLQAFVMHGLAPLNEQIGLAWLQGRAQVYEEHLYTEAVQSVLRGALQPFQLADRPRRPCVLLTTVPGEEHALGLLMAEAMFALEGASCIALGTQTPVSDIAVAARAQDVDIVGLSFTGCLSAARIDAALAELRVQLPQAVEIWAGGTAMASLRGPGARQGAVSGFGLADIGPAVADWRRRAALRAD